MDEGEMKYVLRAWVEARHKQIKTYKRDKRPVTLKYIQKEFTDPTFNNEPDIYRREDGWWLVARPSAMTHYPDKDTLLVALAMHGLDVTKLEELEE